MGRIDERLKELGIALPEAPKPAANYVPYRVSGSQVFIAGQVSIITERSIVGKLGGDLSVEEGYEAARLCGLNILAQLRAAVGDGIDGARAVKLGGFVNAVPDFTQPPPVVNGASDLLVEVLGPENGAHARFAVAVASLPSGAAVEVDAVFEVA